MGMKKTQLIFVLSLLILGAFVLLNSNHVYAVGETTVCAEKTLDGAWCQNVPQSQVNTNFRSAPTSCEAVAYCRVGTCINSQEGECQPNVAKRVCDQNNGVWDQRDFDEIPQCQLGCCILGDEAAFTTQTSCKSLSADHGLETNFRQDIRDEIQCIASAGPNIEGACVFEEDFQRTCRQITKSECQTLEAGSLENVEFHEGLLCSAEILATNCGPSQKTTCVVDADEVRFLDTCGNIGNIYDSSKINDQEYWSNIKERDESCNPGSGNINSASCGSCNYLLGSTCQAFERGETARPQFGDNICKDLGCEWQGQDYQHGETWCDVSTRSSSSEPQNVPGEEHFRLVCYNNEVTVESCAAFRNEVCFEGEVNGFSVAQCKTNIWGDCALIDNQVDCEDIENHDCQWLEGQTNAFFVNDENEKFVLNTDGELFDPDNPDEDLTKKEASCVPRFAPGFDFWTETAADETLAAEEWCPIANEAVVVRFEKGLFDNWDCVDNCEFVTYKGGTNPNMAKVNEEWERQRNTLCTSLGDCGSSVNYIGVEGYHNGSAAVIESFDPDE